jgi:hypothetical protein
LPTSITRESRDGPAARGETLAELRKEERADDVVGVEIVVEEEGGGHSGGHRKNVSTQSKKGQQHAAYLKDWQRAEKTTINGGAAAV